MKLKRPRVIADKFKFHCSEIAKKEQKSSKYLLQRITFSLQRNSRPDQSRKAKAEQLLSGKYPKQSSASGAEHNRLWQTKHGQRRACLQSRQGHSVQSRQNLTRAEKYNSAEQWSQWLFVAASFLKKKRKIWIWKEGEPVAIRCSEEKNSWQNPVPIRCSEIDTRCNELLKVLT